MRMEIMGILPGSFGEYLGSCRSGSSHVLLCIKQFDHFGELREIRYDHIGIPKQLFVEAGGQSHTEGPCRLCGFDPVHRIFYDQTLVRIHPDLSSCD